MRAAGGLFVGWSGRQGVRLHDAVRRLAVAEARIAVQRLAVGDWAGAHESAVGAEAEAVCIGWAAMVGAAVRLQARAVLAEREARAEYDEACRRMTWGLW